jgi:pseudouridine-5'-phosphate glycosidase
MPAWCPGRAPDDPAAPVLARDLSGEIAAALHGAARWWRWNRADRPRPALADNPRWPGAGGCRRGAVSATIAVIGGRRGSASMATLERCGPRRRGFTRRGRRFRSTWRAAATPPPRSAPPRIGARAGIRVFATGGIGGVHRGSAPATCRRLEALVRTRWVVSAGPKAIRPARTAEALRRSALVIGYGTGERRRSWSRCCVRSSTGRRPARWPDHLAWRSARGVLVANPIPLTIPPRDRTGGHGAAAAGLPWTASG